MNNNISIRNIEPQEIVINGQGSIGGITTVYVNGVDVTVGSKAYVIVPTKTSELTNDSGFITNADETDPTVPYYVKEITLADINAWNSKQDLLVSGTSIKTINSESILGSGNISVNPGYTAGTGIDIINNEINNTITSYNDLTDLPTIPTKTSELLNDSGYITNTVDDLTNYLSTEFLNKLLPITEDSGTELYIEDTVNIPLRLDLNPSEITQHTTTGKNLFNSNNVESGTFYSTSDGSITSTSVWSQSEFILVNGNENITISSAYLTIDNSYELSQFNSSKQWLQGEQFSLGTSKTYTLNANTKYIKIGFRNDRDTTNNLQIEKGSTATDYEEYTGGVASPNPDYPQDIHTVNGENTINVIGKNLLPNNATTTTTNGITFTANTDGTISVSGTASATAYLTYPTFSLNAGTYTLSAGVYVNILTRIQLVEDISGRPVLASTENASSKTFTITATKNVFLQFRINSGEVINTTFKPQLEKGSTATAYTPFVSESYPIDLSYVYNSETGTTEDFNLCKIITNNGEYETFFFKNYKDSKYYNSSAPESTIYYNKGVFKYICNPDDDWNWYEFDDYYVVRVNLDDLRAGTLTQFKLYSNYFLDFHKKDPNNKTCATAVSNTIYINLDPSFNITTLEDWKDFITNNEVVFYIARQGTTINYQRESTIEKWADLSSQYHDVMDNAMAYDGATNVIQTNNDLPFDLKGSSYKKIS